MPYSESAIEWIEDSEPEAEFGDRRNASAANLGSDAELLDAYSRAVTAVVDDVGPAVVSLGVGSSGNRRPNGGGSGFAITPDGYILTNSHVVRSGSRYEVTFMDGDRCEGSLVGDDEATDLALLRVSAGNLDYATLGDSTTLRVGQLVIAMGNPLGFQSTVSTGVVSGLGRALRSEEGRLIENIVQHTSPLNPGNSGGPLLDSRGRVVGVNTAIIAMAQGIGFSVPASTAHWVVSQLLSHGRVRRGYLGIIATTRPLGRRRVRFHELDAESAVEVHPRGPAALAGVRERDLLVAIEDQTIATVDDLHRSLSEGAIGRALEVTVLRGKKRVRLTLHPTEAESKEQPA